MRGVQRLDNCDHSIRVAVRVVEVKCPRCGPCRSYVCDSCGYGYVIPSVVDRDGLAGPDQVCGCGEQVLIAMEPA